MSLRQQTILLTWDRMAGDRGGTVVTCGTPEEVAEHPTSYTGKYVKKMLERYKENVEKYRNN